MDTVAIISWYLLMSWLQHGGVVGNEYYTRVVLHTCCTTHVLYYTRVVLHVCSVNALCV